VVDLLALTNLDRLLSILKILFTFLQNKLGWRYDTQHNDVQHNDTQHNNIQHKSIQHNDNQHNI